MVEAALTTALTDRPYSNAFALYAGDAPRSLPGGSTGGVAARTNGGGGGGGSAGSRGGDEGLGEDHDEDDLAEVDFRQQYDDFA